MHFAILSGGSGWHVRDLQRAAAQHGHSCNVVDFRLVSAGVAFCHDAFADCDAVIVRTMPPGSLEQVVFRMDVFHRLEARGVRILNPPRSLEICVDKYHASARLEAAGLRVPPTFVCQDADTAMANFEKLGGDVVVKPLFGSEGRGMVRVHEAELAWRTFRAIERTQAVIYLQQFIHHPGWDLRAFVLGGRVVAAMRRVAKNCWRTNVAQGAKAEAVSVTAEEERLALAAAKAVDAEVSGIDLLPGPAGELYLLEVNAVPGWRALTATTGADIAGQIINHLEVASR